MKPELIRKCTSCGKIQEGKKEGYYIVLIGNNCECGGNYEISFK